jgi:heat shock protein HslJ
MRIDCSSAFLQCCSDICLAQSIPTVQRKKVPLEGTTCWQLTEWKFNGQNISLLPQRPITIQFNGQRLGGSTGCNSYGADYCKQNAQLQLVGAVISTRIACQPEVAERENNI